MQCRDKNTWKTMTQFKVRNNMAYASQMQFEVLRRALWVGSTGQTKRGLRMEILGSCSSRPEDVLLFESACESEDV